MARHLRTAGYAEPDIDAAVDRLRYFRPMENTTGGDTTPIILEQILGTVTPDPEAPGKPLSPRGAPLVDDLHGHAGAGPDIGYVISIRPRSGFRRLHLLGACPRKPGVDYLRYVQMGTKCPPAEEFNDYCKQCWRESVPVTALAQEDSDGSTSSSSSTSSSERAAL